MFALRRFSIAAALCLAMPASAAAAPEWVGDIETGDLSQFTFLLNPTVGESTYAYPQMEEVAQGEFAARIELHNDATWPNGLKRVELQHRPAPGRTAEGQTTFFAWSVYLPVALPEEPSQQIGYWESNETFQQMMAFAAVGTSLRFITQRPRYQVQWEGEGVLTAGAWHRIAMQIDWSTDAQQGAVSVWFDGEQVVNAAGAQTLADGNDHFVQIGLLRGTDDFDDVPVILIDHALEGDSLEDVEYDALPDNSGESTGSSSGGASTGEGDSGSTSVGDTTTGDAATSSGGDSPTTGDPPSTTTGEMTGGDTDTDTDTDTDGTPGRGLPVGCSVDAPERGVAMGLLVLLGLMRRRRSLRAS